MALKVKDLMKSIGGAFSRVSADITRRPDGGTSHYRPLRKKTAEPQAGDMTMNQPQDQDLRYVHTGFTGMNPPTFFGGYDQQTAYGQTNYSQTAYGQTAYGNTSWQPAYGQQQNQTNYFRPQEQAPQGNYVGKGSFGGQTGFTMARRSSSNISYMPGVEPGAGRGQVHVEHIITLTGLKSCYEAIECMKDGETLIVMLDAIANESESMRCQDMLAGAAFTLGCSVRLLQGARIVVIAPEGVKILPEQAAADMRMPEMPPVRAAAPVQAAPPRRERRQGANAAEWNAARSGQLEGYNPYTGTMPVAAGSYASFGGYGM
ncbi:MAG: cell division protein SepF [Clostridiales bacterium]|nr:cell division protein SepF [Clostridiales bacterium]